MDAVASTSDGSAVFKFKVVLLGEGAVGKSSLMLRYVENKFNPKHISTIQASFLCKKIKVDESEVELNIWDTAGQERFHALGPIYYRGSHGAILVFDVTDLHSFEKVKAWVKELRLMLGDSVVLQIVGNKIDLERSRNVDTCVASEFAISVDAEYCETSAKENIGVSAMFQRLSKVMIEKAKQSQLLNAENGVKTVSQRNSLLIVDDEPVQNKRCCSS
ncbi:hypothetical protein AB6A40_001017 [Gnathostoma spinigerum]|uniref:Ras-related protein Rab-21 n=1 Tax=Gnathostoma spinigerum TaxID=75299 RepID=A0ABD6EBY6_9BILA